jgi:TIR domain
LASIFISYRREDAGGHAGRLCDRLTARFGGDRLFMDIQDIRPGQNFATSIEDTIATCDCVIAVIGPRWLETIRKRAGSSDDFVRREIGAALERHVTVVPVLVGGARMPAAAELPADLAELSFLNALEIRDERFDRDVVELETFLSNSLHVEGNSAAASRPRLMRGAAIALLAAALAIGGYFLLRAPAKMDGRPASAPSVTPSAVEGNWIAEMQKAGQPRFRIRLHFERVGDMLGGMVSYPTGDGPMHDVKLAGSALTFYTVHTPQFESEPATIRFQAEVADGQIHLTSTDPGGVATGVATRSP